MHCVGVSTKLSTDTAVALTGTTIFLAMLRPTRSQLSSADVRHLLLLMNVYSNAGSPVQHHGTLCQLNFDTRDFTLSAFKWQLKTVLFLSMYDSGWSPCAPI